MQFPEENQQLLDSLAQARDTRTRWQKLDDWFSDHPIISWSAAIVTLAFLVFLAVNLEFGWVDLRPLVVH